MIAEDDSSNYEDISERNDTLSTAPTVLMGFNESEDRMLDVRTPSHIPGKRRAPKPPPPVPKNPPPIAPSTPTSNYERIHSKVAKVNKLAKIDANENNDSIT